MLPKRVIPCLDIDGGRVVKGTEFVDIRDMGDPVELARKYEAEGADELVLLDITATSGSRSPMVELVRRTAAEVFIPFTVGGGIRSETDAQAVLDAGADKVAVNSAALADPTLINRLAERFGSSCVVLAIDAKQDTANGWEVYAAGGREAAGRNAAAWAREGVERGAGEVLLTSIDRDGTQAGYDLSLTKAVTEAVDVPVIASGGAGRPEHYAAALRQAGAEAVLAASQFHSGDLGAGTLKDYLADNGIAIRLTLAKPFVSDEQASRPRIAIVDYGMGNRYSVFKALERAGAAPVLTAEAGELAETDGIVLPGVGAFRPAMERLDESGLGKALRCQAILGKPILGICLGEQLLFDASCEGGWYPGLGLIPGTVQPLDLPARLNIGWREVRAEQPEPLLAGPAYFYHLHQYAARPLEPTVVAASARLPYPADPDYGAAALVRRQNIAGTQFHPEKSGPAGLRLLRNFADICLSAKTSLQ